MCIKEDVSKANQDGFYRPAVTVCDCQMTTGEVEIVNGDYVCVNCTHRPSQHPLGSTTPEYRNNINGKHVVPQLKNAPVYEKTRVFVKVGDNYEEHWLSFRDFCKLRCWFADNIVDIDNYYFEMFYDIYQEEDGKEPVYQNVFVKARKTDWHLPKSWRGCILMTSIEDQRRLSPDTSMYLICRMDN